MKQLFTFACILFITTTNAQPTGIFANHADVGNPKIKGTAIYDKKTKTYTISGGGYNIWFNRDEFQYAYKKLKEILHLPTILNLLVKERKDIEKSVGW